MCCCCGRRLRLRNDWLKNLIDWNAKRNFQSVCSPFWYPNFWCRCFDPAQRFFPESSAVIFSDFKAEKMEWLSPPCTNQNQRHFWVFPIFRTFPFSGIGICDRFVEGMIQNHFRSSKVVDLFRPREFETSNISWRSERFFFHVIQKNNVTGSVGVVTVWVSGENPFGSGNPTGLYGLMRKKYEAIFKNVAPPLACKAKTKS